MIESFLSCDWGTSRFRLRLIDVVGHQIRAECSSEEGVASLFAACANARQQRFAEVLQRHVDRLSQKNDVSLEQTPIVISGMASSSIGWRDLPYADLPFSLSGDDLPLSQLDEEAAPPSPGILLCSGVRSLNNVMRGEEVEVMGLNTLFPQLMSQANDLWVVLPGTHSKHVRVRCRSITEFHTHMTGELFQLLAGHSSLRHAGDGEANGASTPSLQHSSSQEAFAEGVELMGRANLGETLFQVRVGQLLRGNDPQHSRSLLSGLLIGDEIRSLLARCDRRSIIILCASPELSPSYRMAFERLRSDQEVIVLPPADVARLSAWGQLQILARELGAAPRNESARRRVDTPETSSHSSTRSTNK